MIFISDSLLTWLIRCNLVLRLCPKNDEVILMLRRSSQNGCLVSLSKFFHAKWLICGGVERQRYVYVLAVL